MLLRCGQTVRPAAAVRQLLSPCALGSHLQPKRPVSETRNPRAASTTSISIFLQSTSLSGSDPHSVSYFLLPSVPWCDWTKQTVEVLWKEKWPIISSGVHPWLNIIFHTLQVWRGFGNVRAESGQHLNSCPDNRKKEFTVSCQMWPLNPAHYFWIKSMKDWCAEWCSHTSRYLTSFWICQYSEGRSAAVSIWLLLYLLKSSFWLQISTSSVWDRQYIEKIKEWNNIMQCIL